MAQRRMFELGDLPLFSGTVPQVEVEEFKPAVVVQQERMFECSVCRDGGWIRVGVRGRYGSERMVWCTCAAGAKMRRK